MKQALCLLFLSILSQHKKIYYLVFNIKGFTLLKNLIVKYGLRYFSASSSFTLRLNVRKTNTRVPTARVANALRFNIFFVFSCIYFFIFASNNAYKTIHAIKATLYSPYGGWFFVYLYIFVFVCIRIFFIFAKNCYASSASL